MGAVALARAGPDPLLGEAADLLAQQLLLLGQREVHWLPFPSSSSTTPEAGAAPAAQPCLRIQSAITIFWISLVPS